MLALSHIYQPVDMTRLASSRSPMNVQSTVYILYGRFKEVMGSLEELRMELEWLKLFLGAPTTNGVCVCVSVWEGRREGGSEGGSVYVCVVYCTHVQVYTVLWTQIPISGFKVH